MAISKQDNACRTFIINEKEYNVYKDGKHTFVKSEDKIVFNSTKSDITVSQWLKKIRNTK